MHRLTAALLVSTSLLATGCGSDDGCPAGSMPFGERCVASDGGVSPDASTPVCVASGSEMCNGVDDDCDGMIDEGLPTSVYHRDADSDGFGAVAMVTEACAMPEGYAVDDTDCDDSMRTVYPGAGEICNGSDDSCDGVADEGFLCVRGAEVPCATSCGSTGTGDCTSAPACQIPTGASCNPPVEVCNAVDDDCDGFIDDGAALFWGSSTDLGRPAARRVQVVGNGTLYAALIQTGRTVLVRQLDATMTPTGIEAVLTNASLREPSASIVLQGDQVVAVWVGEDGAAIVASTAPLTTLSFPAVVPLFLDTAAQTIDVAASGTKLLVAYRGRGGIRAVRTNTALAVETAETLLVAEAAVDSMRMQFDLTASAGGGWAVAYLDRPAGESDDEVFLQGINASGTTLDGTPSRTRNTTSDAFPALAYDSVMDRFVMAWLEGATANLNTFRLGGSGASRGVLPERPTPVIISSSARTPTSNLATPVALDVAAGAVTAVYVSGTSMATVESSKYELGTLTLSGSGRVAATAIGTDSVGIVTPLGTSGPRPTLLLGRAIFNGTASTQTTLLSCP